MPDIDQVLTEYLAAWNAEDAEERQRLLHQILAPQCVYADSHLSNLIEGKQLHAKFIDQFKSKFPELKISLLAPPEHHHNFFRFRWQLAKADGDVFTQGVFFGAVNQNLEIIKLVGFVD